MACALAFEKVKKDSPRLGGTLVPSALELQRRKQCLMVLVR